MPVTGSCLCGAVSFRITGPMREVIACHCGQCRKTSGHYWSATRVANADIEITDSGTLTWFRSSEEAERGFCNACGSSLFWRRHDLDTISIGAGTLDAPTGLQTAKHIYTADKGDYYEIGE